MEKEIQEMRDGHLRKAYQEFKRLPDNALITVCSNCKTATCWHGKFLCKDNKTAGVTKITVKELKNIMKEHPYYWFTDEEIESNIPEYVEAYTW